MPAAGIIVSAVFATVLVLVQARGGTGYHAFYSALVGLATMTAVVPYAFCALAIALISVAHDKAHEKNKSKAHRLGIIEIVGFIFAMFTLYGCGAEAVLYGLMLMMLGIPVYVWQRSRDATFTPSP